MEWDEGVRIAHEIACLFQTATAFGLVQALRLSELIAAFYRGIAQVSAEQTPYMETDVWSMAPLLAIGLGTLSWLTAVLIMAALLLGGMLLLKALVQRYWPQEISPSLDNVHTVPADLVAAQEDPQKARARAVQE